MPSRRAVLGNLAAGGVVLLSGCGSTGGGGDEPVPEFEPEGRTISAVAPRADGPERFNPYGLNQRGRAVIEPFQQLVLPADATGGEFYTDGHTWTVDGTEVSVTCAVTVPGEPGALEVEGVDYADGGTAYRHDAGEDVDVCGAIERLRAPETSAEARRAAARQCARWYNYALPSFVVAQARDGFFGNVEAFAFSDGEGAQIARPPTWSAAQYHLQAGTVR